MSPQFTKEKYQEMISDYLSGMTQEKVSQKHKTSRTTVSNILRRMGVDVRSYTGERRSNRRWEWDFEFFSKRNPIVAYWAGFVMADGSISPTAKTTSTLTIAVQASDEEHIASFCDHLGLSQDAIYHYKARKSGGPQVEVKLNHSNLIKDFLLWGVIPNKTHNFVEPQVSDELLPHYLRGWADGDGHIYANGTGARFTISGNRQALEWYAQALVRLGYYGGHGFQKRENNIAVLYIGGVHQVSEIIHILQVDGNFKLERKWSVTYETKFSTVTHTCEQCDDEFEVNEHRHNFEPEHGRFCSRKCRSDYDYWHSGSHVIEDGIEKHRCTRCGEYKTREEFSGNEYYCKPCWKEYDTEKRRERGIKEFKSADRIVEDGIVKRKCSICKNFVPEAELANKSHCKPCHAQYMREYRERKKSV